MVDYTNKFVNNINHILIITFQIKQIRMKGKNDIIQFKCYEKNPYSAINN